MTRFVVLLCAVLLLSLFSIACAGHSASPGRTPLGQSFELRAGSSAAVEGGLQIVFERVPSDSRCPMDALCIRAGEARVALTVSQDGRNADRRELRTDGAASETTYLGYSIKLIALAPYPRSDRQILPEDYVATLAVVAR
jgi:hypothetical protein